jgi:hypothetical protein
MTTCTGTTDTYTTVSNFLSVPTDGSPYTQIKPCNGLVSTNGIYKFVILSNGKMVIYNTSANEIVQKLYDNTVTYPFFCFQKDGNLVLYDGEPKELYHESNTPYDSTSTAERNTWLKGTAKWNSSTNGRGGKYLFLKDDGTLVITKDDKTSVVWSSLVSTTTPSVTATFAATTLAPTTLAPTTTYMPTTTLTTTPTPSTSYMWLIILIFILILGMGGGYYYYTNSM